MTSYIRHIDCVQMDECIADDNDRTMYITHSLHQGKLSNREFYQKPINHHLFFKNDMNRRAEHDCVFIKTKTKKTQNKFCNDPIGCL